MARSEIIVCLLPLTAETEGILNARAFDPMPRGGSSSMQRAAAMSSTRT